MPINGRRPITEIVEVAQNELVREQASSEQDKYFGMANQIYSNDLPAILSESFIKKEAYITTIAAYTDGTVTVGSGTSTILGSSTSWTSANSDGRLIDISGSDTIYRVTYSADTELSYQDSLTYIASSGTGKTYTLFSDRYALPSDFATILSDDPEDPHVVYRFNNRSKIYLNLLSEEEFNRDDALTTGTPWGYQVRWIKEQPYLYLTNAATGAEIIGYSYVPQLTTLTEYTSGLATFTTGTAVIATTAASWLVNITTGTNTYYIRNDADGTGSASKWGKILSVTDATTLTLASAWGFTSGTGISYTISEVSKWPARFDDAILYKTALIVDPDNLNTEKWKSVYLDAISADKAQETRRASTSQLKHYSGMRRNSR